METKEMEDTPRDTKVYQIRGATSSSYISYKMKANGTNNKIQLKKTSVDAEDKSFQITITCINKITPFVCFREDTWWWDNSVLSAFEISEEFQTQIIRCSICQANWWGQRYVTLDTFITLYAALTSYMQIRSGRRNRREQPNTGIQRTIEERSRPRTL